jgi:uncharacterized damage-inducible protein DinB
MKELINQEMKKWLHDVAGLNDLTLNRKWEWQGYNEGIRFAFFRLLEELRALATNESVFPAATEKDESYAVRRYLTDFHLVYWDLRVLLSDVNEKLFDQEPDEKEWTLRHILSHLIDNEWAFYGVFRYGFEFSGTDEIWPTDSIPDQFFDDHFDEFGHFTDEIFQYSLDNILDFFDEKHKIVLANLSRLLDTQLEQQLVFWEAEPKTARFRLIRFESHFRQHTIQAEKTIRALTGLESEVQQILRTCMNAYSALDARLRFTSHDETQLSLHWERNIKPYLQVIESQIEKS